MAFDYLETAQEAVELLAEFGALATITANVTPAADDLAAPDYTTAPTPAGVAVTAYAVVLDYEAGKFNNGNEPGAVIRVGDRQLYFAALDVNGAAINEDQLPIDADVAGPDGRAYKIKNVKPLAPAGVAVLFECNVRRG